PKDDPLKRQPDINLAKKILDWTPKINRSQGIKSTLEYFKTLSKDQLNKIEHKEFKKFLKK
ncbi:MAG: SDR family NAD-dependent epimerase/dehydratase, partial [Flavobacteriaceae bacterium]